MEYVSLQDSVMEFLEGAKIVLSLLLACFLVLYTSPFVFFLWSKIRRKRWGE